MPDRRVLRPKQEARVCVLSAQRAPLPLLPLAQAARPRVLQPLLISPSSAGAAAELR